MVELGHENTGRIDACFHTMPADIEKQSFAIIGDELQAMGKTPDPQKAPIVKRVIHATADFDYADTLYFSPTVLDIVPKVFVPGTLLVTDTNMALAGINKKVIAKLGMEACCFMADPDIAAAAKEKKCTRAAVSMEKAAVSGRTCIFVIGNAPTALIRLYELIRGGFRPAMIIGMPVGFVNVVQSKELIMETDVPCIVSRGRKGGSNAAAAVCNALLYQLDETRGADVR